MHPLLDLSARPVIGHRGCPAHAPENTLESFRQAVASGADALELDVRLTREGEVVVIHDPALDRTTDRSGVVREMTAAEINEADAGAHYTLDGGASFPWRGRGLRVPLLREVLDALPDTPLLVELKDAAAAPAVRDVILSAGAAKRCVVASFLADAIPAFHAPGMATASTRRDTVRLLARAVLRLRPQTVPFDVMCVPIRYRRFPVPVEGFVRILEPLGVPVHVWTVNDPEIARRLWEIGVRGIITDDPGRMVRERERVAGGSALART